MVQNILDYLEATAADCPDKPAFEDLEHSYTFAHVLGNAKRIGSGLLQVLTQNAPVPVLMEKEAWTLNVFMGAVCAGCFYTLVEPEQPDERIRTILDTLEAEVIVTSGKLSERVAALGFTGKVLLAEELAEREEGALMHFYKASTLPPEVAKYQPPVDLDELLDGMTLAKLKRIFEQVMKRQENKVDPIRSKFGTIRREPVSLETKIGSVLAYARKKRRFSFRQLLERQSDKLEIVVTFLAVLELMKIGKIHLTQEETFGDMDIEALEPEGMDEEPDLAELSDFEE